VRELKVGSGTVQRVKAAMKAHERPQSKVAFEHVLPIVPLAMAAAARNGSRAHGTQQGG
jgi:hypothetical protein